MPRGFIWAVYIDDLDRFWRLLVNADYVDQEQRGWVAADPTVTTPLPRQWLPRKVVGTDPEGRRRGAIVGNVAADLWTGASDTFELEGSDGVFYPITVTEKLGERRV